MIERNFDEDEDKFPNDDDFDGDFIADDSFLDEFQDDDLDCDVFADDLDRDPADDIDWPDDFCREDEFAEPGVNSALRAESPTNPRNLPCPNCGQQNRLTPKDVALGYQCNECAQQVEMGY